MYCKFSAINSRNVWLHSLEKTWSVAMSSSSNTAIGTSKPLQYVATRKCAIGQRLNIFHHEEKHSCISHDRRALVRGWSGHAPMSSFGWRLYQPPPPPQPPPQARRRHPPVTATVRAATLAKFMVANEGSHRTSGRNRLMSIHATNKCAQPSISDYTTSNQNLQSNTIKLHTTITTWQRTNTRCHNMALPAPGCSGDSLSRTDVAPVRPRVAGVLLGGPVPFRVGSGVGPKVGPAGAAPGCTGSAAGCPKTSLGGAGVAPGAPRLRPGAPGVPQGCPGGAGVAPGRPGRRRGGPGISLGGPGAPAGHSTRRGTPVSTKTKNDAFFTNTL